MARSCFISPRKGTKARRFINLMLRPQGLTWIEAFERDLIRTPGAMSGLMSRLEYDCGFDIRVIGQIRNPHKRGRSTLIYRIVGRHRWNGVYRSFIEPTEETRLAA